MAIPLRKIFLTLLNIGIILFILSSTGLARAANIELGSINFSPSAGVKIGDKITITYSVTNNDAEAHWIHLRIFDPANINNENMYSTKARDNVPPVGSTQEYTYVWDTAVSQSNPGFHRVDVVVTKWDQTEVLAALNSSYTLAEAQTTPTPTPTFTSTSATGVGNWGTIIFPSTKISSIRDLIVVIIDWLLVLAGALAVIAIIYSGIMYITAGGDPAKAETAKKNLICAIIGVIVIALALVIINTVVSVLEGRGG